MLTPDRVIPFLSHDDEEVRSRARRYLVSAHDPAPATAEDFWAAADKRPPEEAGAYLDRLGLVPQTEASLRRLLDELPKADPATRDSLRRTLERVEFDLLKQHWDTIHGTEAVPEAVRSHLQARLDLASEPPEPLWDRMMSLAKSWNDRDISEVDELEADRLIEAVARHPDVFRDRVLAALSDENVKGWDELFVVDVAGEMKLADATPTLLNKLNADDGDLLWELAADALVHIGDGGVIRQIAERFPEADEGFQISASEVLGRIKRPESQAALLTLLEQVGADATAKSSLVLALTELIPDDEPTIATLREIARAGSYDRMVLHLDEDLLAISTMTGVALPEADEWREQIGRRRAEWSMGMSNVDALFQSAGSLGPSTMHAAPLRPQGRGGTGSARSAAAVAERPVTLAAKQPFRNTKPKVGRNDPCPCGSGKKFKKCCGK